MKYLILMLLCLINFNSQAAICDGKPFISSQTGDGKAFGLFIEEKDFKNSPEWSLNLSEPPLSISQAVEIINSWSEGYYQKFDQVNIQSIEIKSPWCLNDKTWVYIFKLEPRIDGNPVWGSYMAAVTMSGVVIEPKEVVVKSNL